MPAWTNRKIERLCLRYPTASQEDLLAEFAPHTLCAIYNRAQSLGLTRHRRDWMDIANAHVPTFTFGRELRS